MSLDDMRELPLWWAFCALSLICFLRANATYWVGRLVVAGGRRSTPRLERFLNGPTMAGAERFMARWGLLAVPLCFLTVGIQTAVNLTAGALRMPLRRYLPSVAIGAMIWGLLYATIGLAAVEAVLLGLARSPWALVALAIAVGLFLLVRRLGRSMDHSGRNEGASGPDPDRPLERRF